MPKETKYSDEKKVKKSDEFDETLSNVLLVDGLPIVPVDKLEKLTGYCSKFFRKFEEGVIANDNFILPLDETGKKTSGYAFVEYENATQAAAVLQKVHGYRFDSTHTLTANIASDFDRLKNLSEEYKAPPPKELSENKVNLREWLKDELLRDQFVVRHGQETEVWWNDPYRRANEKGRQLCYAGDREKQEKKNWTKLYVMWSPQGSYLATFHREGILLWGGDNFFQIARFKHLGVKWIDFSPQENFLVTCNGAEKDPECVKIWDIRTGEKKRGFEKGFAPGWPIFKWSFDDKYFARVEKDKLMIYESETMGLVDKKSVAVERVHEVQWSPKQHLLAYWVPERDSDPATVALLELPSKRKIRDIHVHTRSQLCPRRLKEAGAEQTDKCTATKPCRDCKITLHWQSQGEYLAAKLCRRKTKNKISTTFHIVRLGDGDSKEAEKKESKEIPVEVLDIEDSVLYFAWEPNAKRFGVIHGDGQRNTVRFYELKNNKLKLQVQLPERQANCLWWSPRGNIVVLAGLGVLNGILEWYDVSAKETAQQVQHFMCTDVEWDPSGRYVITAVTQPLRLDHFYRYNTENGYRLWDMYGKSLSSVRLESCYQVNWRPRPPRLLNSEQEKEIKKNLKVKYWDKFQKEDEDIESGQLDDWTKQRKKMEAEWKKYREEARKGYEEEESLRRQLGVVEDKEADFEEMEEVVEEELSVTEEIIG